MSHTVTAKLNQAAREHRNQNGVTFFVSLGEKNYDFKQKANVWTNYDAALFAKDAQIDFYRSSLVEGAIVSVSATGIILDASDPQYKPKLVLQDAKLGFVNSPNRQAPAQQSEGYQQQAPAPQQQGGFVNQGQQQGGFAQQAPRPMDQAMAQNGIQPSQQTPQLNPDNEPPF
tara:strand:- start:529 stop:1044 length:516 start_codon:yes stop_codon:yes gene_type:complete